MKNNKEFQILLNCKMDKMYDENKISQSCKDDLRHFSEMYKKAYHFDNTICDFNTFEIYQVQRGNEFLEIDKEEYSMDGYAEEICKYFFNLTK